MQLLPAHGRQREPISEKHFSFLLAVPEFTHSGLDIYLWSVLRELVVWWDASLRALRRNVFTFGEDKLMGIAYLTGWTSSISSYKAQ